MSISDQNKSKNKSLLKKQDIVLLKNSEEVKNTNIYGNLYESLAPYTKLSLNDLKKDIVFDDKARMSLLHNKDKMMEHIKSEWYAKTSFEITDREVHCQLCGAKNLYICYICNRINGVELHVGRECVKSYKDINGADIVLAKIDSKVRDMNKEARRSNFDVILGDDVDFTKNARDMVDSFPVLIPNPIYKELMKAITDCNRIRTIYISSGGDLDESIEKFRIVKKKFNDLYQKARDHYDKNKNDPLICTLEIARWLNKNCPIIIPDIQSANGILTADTLQYVYEPNFVKRNIPVFMACLKEDDVKFVNVEGNVIRFAIQNARFVQPIYFTVSMKNLMKNVGYRCMTQNKYRFSKNNLPPVIDNNYSNINSVMNYFNGVLTDLGYSIINEERTSQLYWEKRQEKVLQKRWTTHTNNLGVVYKAVTLERVLAIMSHVFYFDNRSEREVAEIIVSKINTGGYWITKAERDRDARLASEAAGRQTQRDFIPYV